MDLNMLQLSSSIVHVSMLTFYAILFVVTLATIASTLAMFPLFPLQLDSIEWSNKWLGTTVIDYYGACLCFSGVVISSEDSYVRGFLWVLSFNMLGSPFCCLWVLARIYRGDHLRLESRRHLDFESR